MRFIFVHGTGVRRERFDKLAPMVASGLTVRFPGSEFVPCYWGDAFGTDLSAGGASIPGVDGTRGVAATGPLDHEIAEWLLLLTDPLCELRVLAKTAAAGDDGLQMPGVRAAGEEIADRVAKLQGGLPPGELTLLLQSTGMTLLVIFGGC